MVGRSLSSPPAPSKQLAKLARLALIPDDLQETAPAASLRVRLRPLLAKWLDGTNGNPFVYDTTWGGVVTARALANPSLAFGQGRYDDHHFHHGYFLYAADEAPSRRLPLPAPRARRAPRTARHPGAAAEDPLGPIPRHLRTQLQGAAPPTPIESSPPSSVKPALSWCRSPPPFRSGRPGSDHPGPGHAVSVTAVTRLERRLEFLARGLDTEYRASYSMWHTVCGTRHGPWATTSTRT